MVSWSLVATLLALASAQLAAGQTTRPAEQDLARAVSSRPRDPGARSRYAVFLQQQGRTDEALAHFQAALDLAPQAAEYAFNLALAMLHLSRAAESLAVLDRHPAASGDHLVLRGAVLNALDRPAEAALALRRAVALDPANPDSLYDLALTLLKINASAEATALLDSGRRRFPGVAKLHAASGMVAYLHGKNADAVRAYEAAVKLEPGAADLFASLGDVYDATGDLVRAGASYGKSLRLDSSVATVHVKLGRNQLKLQHPREAGEAFAAALQRDPANSAAHFELGKLAAARGEHDAAISHYRQAVVSTPSLKEAWYQLGISYRRAGQEEQSLAALEQFRKLP